MTTALVDADIVAYRSAASAEHDSEEIAILRADKTMRDITIATDASEVLPFLSGSSNFRKELYPEYKANRDKMVRPLWLQRVREFLVLEWDAEVTDGYEADDALGINAGKDTVICSIDKDLRQISGQHYDFVRGEFSDVDPLDGWKNFYKQMLTGDRSDNVPGIQGIGPVRANRVISSCISPFDMARAVQAIYKDDKTLIRNGRLLYIWRQINDQWSVEEHLKNSSEERHVEEAKFASTPTKQEASSRFMALGGTKRKKGGSRVRGTKKGK